MAHGRPEKGIDLMLGLETRIGELINKRFIRDTRDLAVNGKTVMEILGLTRGPEVGRVLKILMEEVTDHPELNTENELRSIL